MNLKILINKVTKCLILVKNKRRGKKTPLLLHIFILHKKTTSDNLLITYR